MNVVTLTHRLSLVIVAIVIAGTGAAVVAEGIFGSFPDQAPDLFSAADKIFFWQTQFIVPLKRVNLGDVFFPSSQPPVINLTQSDVCPSVCKEMWQIDTVTFGCKFLECGSGCGTDNITTFETEEDCNGELLSLIGPPGDNPDIVDCVPPDCVFDGPPEISNVEITDITQNSVSITWTSNKIGSAVIQYGVTSQYYTNTEYTTIVSGTNSVQLSGLSQNKTYYFIIISFDEEGNAGQSEEYSFATPGPYLSGCNDTDSVSYPTINDGLAGTMVFGIYSYSDYCVDAQNLNEYYCQSAQGPILNRTVSCISGCFAGKCNGVTEDPPLIREVNVSLVTYHSATITWETDKRSSSRVKYGTVRGNYPREVSGVEGLNHVVVLDNLDQDTTYYFVVISGGTVGNNAQSAEKNFTTLEDYISPEIRNINVTNIYDVEATIRWETSEPSISLVAYGSPADVGNGEYLYPDVDVSEFEVMNHSMTLTNLSPLTTYHFVIGAVDSAFNDNYSSVQIFTTTSLRDLIAPKIYNVTLNITHRNATIKWITDEASSSVVQYRNLNGSYINVTGPGAVTIHSVTITNLDPLTDYAYRIVSADSSGNTNLSTESVFRTSSSSLSDTLAPTVNIAESYALDKSFQQADGYLLKTFEATATDNVGISEINVFFNDEIVLTCTSSPCRYSTNLQEGETYWYYATANDTSNNIGRDPLSGAHYIIPIESGDAGCIDQDAMFDETGAQYPTNNENSYYTISFVNINNGSDPMPSSGNDFCTGSILTEYYCMSRSDSMWSVQNYSCPYGCRGSEGVCNRKPLITSLSATPVIGSVPMTVNFSASISDDDRTFRYLWKFGDGGGASGQSSGSTKPKYQYVDAGTYTAVLTVNDSMGGVDSKSIVITVTTPAVMRSGGQPSGNLPAGTTSAVLSLTTDKASTCKYATTPNVSYTAMINTFSATGGLTHSSTVSGLSNFTSYTYYVRCMDATGKSNSDDYLISFFVRSSDVTAPVISGISHTVYPNSIHIRWNTNEYSTSVVKYGPSLSNIIVGYNATYHIIALYGLTPSTQYAYVINSTDMYGNSYQTEMRFFVTDPEQCPPDILCESTPSLFGYVYPGLKSVFGIK